MTDWVGLRPDRECATQRELNVTAAWFVTLPLLAREYS